MSEKKVFISDNDTAVITCPECRKAKLTDVSQYIGMDRAARIKFTCKCGHTYGVLLERRKYYRKETNFPGIYIISGKDEGRPMKVKNISLVGLKFEVDTQPDFAIDDPMTVEFSLDDKQNSFIRKNVVVKKMFDRVIGAEFSDEASENETDDAIKSYIIP
jgi:hypothetical protein